MQTSVHRVDAGDGTSLAVTTAGTGPAVLLVHGLGFDRTCFDAAVAAVVARGGRAIAPDLRGCGASDMPAEPYDIATLAADLDGVRGALGLERFRLVGHSLGGMVAQRYVLDHPERVDALFLASTACHMGRRASALGRTLSILAEHGFDAAMADPELAAEVEELCRAVAPYAPAVLEPLKKVTARPDRARALAWRATVGFSVRSAIAAVRCPTTVMHGTRDLLIPFRAGELLAATIPGARFDAVPGAGHNLPVRAPERFADAVCAMLPLEEAT